MMKILVCLSCFACTGSLLSLVSLSRFPLLPQPCFLVSPSASAVVGSLPRANKVGFLMPCSKIAQFSHLTLHYPQGCGSSAARSPNPTNCSRSSCSVEPSTFVSIYSSALFRFLIIIFSNRLKEGR